MSSNVLIAYFSHEGEAYAAGTIVTLKIGNTRVAAEMMAEMTGADLHRIETVHPYPFSHMETVEIAQKEQKQNARPELQPADLDMASYDTIILGYPNWWGTMPMPVFTFLEQYDLRGKTILPFCTHEGSGMGHSEADIKALCADANVGKGLAITGNKVNQAKKDIENWLKKAEIL